MPHPDNQLHQGKELPVFPNQHGLNNVEMDPAKEPHLLAFPTSSPHYLHLHITPLMWSSTLGVRANVPPTPTIKQALTFVFKNAINSTTFARHRESASVALGKPTKKVLIPVRASPQLMKIPNPSGSPKAVDSAIPVFHRPICFRDSPCVSSSPSVQRDNSGQSRVINHSSPIPSGSKPHPDCGILGLPTTHWFASFTRRRSPQRRSACSRPQTTESARA